MKKIFIGVATLGLLMVVATVPYRADSYAAGAVEPYSAGRSAAAEAGTAAGPPRPDPMRYICALKWDQYYKSKGIEVDVSTRGRYNEVLVISCPMCSVKEHVVEPFLFTVSDGKTGMEKIKECGFKQVAFRGSLGMRELVYDVPE